MRFIAGAAMVVCLCATAHSEDRAKAQSAYQAAKQHYKLGEYREALEGFKEAYRNHEDPILIFDLAQCHRQLGDREQAIRSYRMFLVEKPDAPNRDNVRDMIATLEKQLAAERPPAPTQPDEPTVKPSEPPKPHLKPPPVEPERPVVLVETERAPKEPPPLYKRWWLWTAVGAVVAVGVGVGVGVDVSRSGKTPTAMTDFGTVRFK